MSLLRRHWLFGIVLALAVAIRVLVMLAFRPVMWFGGDSASYLATGLRLTPDPSRVGGYGFLLWLLRPAHSFALVALVQHAMGLASAVIVYALACRYRLPRWAGTLAALPVLFDAYQLQLEHDVLPDAAFGFLVLLALYLVLRAPGMPRPLSVAVAALALGVAALLWPVGLALLLVLLVAALVWAVRGRLSWSMLSWRTRSAGLAGSPALAPAAGRLGGLLAVLATLACGAVPVLAYAAFFDAHQHQFTLTRSDGVFLWSRTMSFADCAVIKPPADQAWLCPPPGPRKAASLYIWDGDSPLLRAPGGQFGARTNDMALNFAKRAMMAQPGGYATAFGHDFLLSFTWNRPVHPSAGIVDRYSFANAGTAWVPATMRTPGGGTVAGDQAAYAGRPSPTRADGPFASWLVSYQKWIYLRGTLLGLIMLAWPVTVLARRFVPGLARGGGSGALPWAFALTILAVPPLIADFDLRYLVPAVPAACLAAVLAFAPAQRRWITSPAATATSDPAAGPPPASADRTTSLPSESTPTASPDSS